MEERPHSGEDDDGEFLLPSPIEQRGIEETSKELLEDQLRRMSVVPLRRVKISVQFNGQNRSVGR